MQILIYLAGAVIAALGQKMNANPKVPSVLVKPALALIGIAFYAVQVHPTGWPGSPEFATWLDKASLWAFALPGAASFMGLFPGMATKTATITEVPNA